MPVGKLHGQVAAIALRAAAAYGFALGGGNALIAYGIIDRPTQDVDVFSDEEGAVQAAADAVEAALRDEGFGPSAGTRPVASRTSFTGWAKGWPSGSSPRTAGSK